MHIEKLAPFECEGPVKNGNLWQYELREDGGQCLIVEHEDRDFSVYLLDSEKERRRQRIRRPGRARNDNPIVDGVIVANLDEGSLVCFVELAGRMADQKEVDRKIAQFVASVSRFAPIARKSKEQMEKTEGDQHHDDWTDLPGMGRAEALPGHPTLDHKVGCVVISNRSVARQLPEMPEIAGVELRLVPIQAMNTKDYNTRRIGVRDLCARTRLFAGPPPSRPKQR